MSRPPAVPSAVSGAVSGAVSAASLGVGLVTLGAGLFVVNAGVSRVALRHGVDALSLTSLRVTGTFGCLLVIAALFRRAALRPPTGRHLVLVLAHGVVGVAALQWTYFVAIDRLPVGMALLLEYQAPILVALWARFVQGEQVRPRLWVGLALAVGGMVLVTEVWRGLQFDSLGILAGLGAAVSFATYFLVGEAGIASLDPLRVILWSFGVATVLLNVLAPVTAVDADLGATVSLLGRLDGGSAPLWLVVAWVVVPGTLVPFFAMLFALRFAAATTVTIVAMLEPIGVAALGWWWFGEALSVVAVTGCVAVVAGIVLAQSARRVSEELPVPT